MEDLKAAEKQTVSKRNEQSMTGLIMIGVGVVFLLAQFGNFGFANWWALFILIPVAAAWGKGVSLMRSAGRITGEAAQSFAGGLFPLFVALIFLLGWNWGTVWPGFIIIAGLNALVGGWFD